MAESNIITFINNWIASVWDLLLDSAFLLLLGILLAGIIHLFLNEKNISRFISGGSKAQVFKLSLLGVPLPLCSCSVLPVAYQLRKSGVSRGGTISFLISTPETGIDSILLTYSLMNPFMTIIRPIAAFITAFVAGLWESIIPDKEEVEKKENQIDSKEYNCCCPSKNDSNLTIGRKILAVIKYGFDDILGDIAFYLVIGYVLAGFVTALIGSDSTDLIKNISTGWGGYLGALIIGVPLYICATSSTPLAAALLAAGFSPGAVMVFLLVGPATNISSIGVVFKILKGWGTIRYFLAIVAVAVLCGLAVDWAHDSFQFSNDYKINNQHFHTGWINILSAYLLSALLVYSLVAKFIKKFK